MSDHADKTLRTHDKISQPQQPELESPQEDPLTVFSFLKAASSATPPPPRVPSHGQILQLQRAIGNRAVQKLLIPTGSVVQRQHRPVRIGPPPTAPTGPTGYTGPVQVDDPIAGRHTTPETADAAVRSAMGPYVQDAIREGRQITDHVYIVDDEMWDRAGEARYGHEEWFDRGHRDEVSAWTERDNNRVFIHRDREDVGTMIHEALHLYSGRESLGSALREGLTEFYTQQILSTLTPPLSAPNHYPEQSRIAGMLIDLVGEDVVARAYFQGEVDALRAAYRAAMPFGEPDDWEIFMDRMEHGLWQSARQFVTPFAT